MKTAREMFEELGFNFEKPTDIRGDEIPFCYRYFKSEGTWFEEISFNDSSKLMFVSKRLNNLLHSHSDFVFYPELLQAIQKQIEELGWNNE